MTAPGRTAVVLGYEDARSARAELVDFFAAPADVAARPRSA